MLLKRSKNDQEETTRKSMDRQGIRVQRRFQKIHLCTTESETKSAFAERNIRSLKNIIYKYLEEKWTWTYIEDLPQFLNTINSRVKRVTHLAPNKVFKKHDAILISLAINTTK